MTVMSQSNIQPEPETPATGIERRRHPRRKVLRAGKVAMNDYCSVYDCQIRDLSVSGAKLRFPELTPIAKNFMLWISNGLLHECVVRRVDGTLIGVEFVGEVSRTEAIRIFGRVFD